MELSARACGKLLAREEGSQFIHHVVEMFAQDIATPDICRGRHGYYKVFLCVLGIFQVQNFIFNFYVCVKKDKYPLLDSMVPSLYTKFPVVWCVSKLVKELN